MTLSLHTTRPADGAVKKRKRVGRGNASGHGTYSTRGLKGQNSRSGVSGLKRLGLKMTLMKTPKKRGFKSLADKLQVVNCSAVNKFFKDGEEVSPKTLIKKGLVRAATPGIKILGDGDLKIKNLKFVNVKMSVSVKEQAEKNGSVIEVKNKK